FGLIQRDRQFVNYQDLEAHYELRPSLWVEPIEDWGKGQVQLFEIPSNADTNDNIVAYWRPEGGLKKGQTFSYNYRLIWLNDINPMPSKTKIVRSAKGKLFEDGSREMIIDFSRIDVNQLNTISMNASSNHGKIIATKLIANPSIDGARVFLRFQPEDADVAELRLQLMNKDTPISETWLYRWIKPSLFAGE
ncbi:glucan biosynthesis protein, partial [Methylophaga sp. UBA3996]